MNYPNDLKYSKSHEWVKTEDNRLELDWDYGSKFSPW